MSDLGVKKLALSQGKSVLFEVNGIRGFHVQDMFESFSSAKVIIVVADDVIKGAEHFNELESFARRGNVGRFLFDEGKFGRGGRRWGSGGGRGGNEVDGRRSKDGAGVEVVVEDFHEGHKVATLNVA